MQMQMPIQMHLPPMQQHMMQMQAPAASLKVPKVAKKRKRSSAGAEDETTPSLHDIGDEKKTKTARNKPNKQKLEVDLATAQKEIEGLLDNKQQLLNTLNERKQECEVLKSQLEKERREKIEFMTKETERMTKETDRVMLTLQKLTESLENANARHMATMQNWNKQENKRADSATEALLSQQQLLMQAHAHAQATKWKTDRLLPALEFETLTLTDGQLDPIVHKHIAEKTNWKIDEGKSLLVETTAQLGKAETALVALNAERITSDTPLLAKEFKMYQQCIKWFARQERMLKNLICNYELQTKLPAPSNSPPKNNKQEDRVTIAVVV